VPVLHKVSNTKVTNTRTNKQDVYPTDLQRHTCDAFRPANRHPDRATPQRQKRQSSRGTTPGQHTTHQRKSTAIPAHTQFMSHI